MKLYSYVIPRDYGFAPNPFHGFCTLATCKPEIRKRAQIGDWVIGTGSKPRGIENRLVYILEVSEILSFNQYWQDPRFYNKRPNLYGSRKMAYGDNIYHRNLKDGSWLQENSHHSLYSGLPNLSNVENDTKTDRVLISKVFTYWGGNGPLIPQRFIKEKQTNILKRGPSHKCNFPEKFVNDFLRWYISLEETGLITLPDRIREVGKTDKTVKNH